MQEQLMIFTRYPEPGKAKTRLIPAVGEEGAAQLHRRMAEHTIAQARSLQKHRPVSIVVHFTGGDRELMQHWLGHDLQYQLQHSGDLGERLTSAFQLAFDQGAKSAIAIGTDCPELNTDLLSEGFNQAETHSLVIGSTSDGGYYLIGLKKLIPELFQNITWGTNLVFQQTLEIAKHLQLKTAYLPMLNDIDRPEDLEFSANALGNLKLLS